MSQRRSKRLQNKLESPSSQLKLEPDVAPSSVKVMKALHPFELYPQEVWHFILDKLSPSDGYGFAVSKTSRSIEAVYERRGKSKQLFSLILPFLKWGSTNDKRKAILQCRLVCRKWRDSVDNYLRSKEKYSLFCINFRNVDKIQRFMTFLSERSLQNCKPFLGRDFRFNQEDRLVMQESDGEEDELEDDDHNEDLVHRQAFRNAVTELLTSTGEHIWNFEFCLDDRVEENTTQYWVEIYTVLRTFATLMPNLKVFHVGPIDSVYGTHHDHEPIQVGSQLQTVMDANECPLLAHVKELNLRKMPEAMTRTLVSYCATESLTSLKLGPGQESCAEVAGKFPNLRYVDLWIYNSSTLSKLEDMPWPLTEAVFKVRLKRYVGYAKGEGITIPLLFEWLGQFEGNLRKLDLYLFGDAYYRGTDANGDKDARICLLSLKELSVTGMKHVGVSSLEFARELKQLKVLNMNVGFMSTPDPKEEILYRGYAPGRMLESNVWEVLPCLRKMVLNDSSGRYKYCWRGSRAASTTQFRRQRGRYRRY